MIRVGSLMLLAVVAAFVPVDADAQFVLRDDTGGWGWLALAPTNRAVVQLVYGSPQEGEQGRLDSRVLGELRALGVRRLWGASDFEPTENQVVAECAAVEYATSPTGDRVYGIHTEVSYWDHTRLAATEIYEAITLNSIASTDLATDTFVDACVGQLARILVRLGFDEG